MNLFVGRAVIFTLGFVGNAAHAEGANSPPTAQFPPLEPAAPPNEPPPSPPPLSTTSAVQPAPVNSAPPAASPPLPPPGYAPYPAYPPPYAVPELVPEERPLPSDSNEVVSLTISPLHLIFPIVQLTGEVRVIPHFGLSLIAGYGTVNIDSNEEDLPTTIKVNAYEIGGRAIWYPIKKFKSFQLGGQLLYLKVATDGALTEHNISGTGAGVAFGPFAGYKLITAAGFTFLAQLGVQYLSAQAEAHDENGISDNAANNRFLPLVNLDIGWSF